MGLDFRILYVFLGEVMAVALPSSFKLASETKISIHPEYDGDISFLSKGNKHYQCRFAKQKYNDKK